MRVLVTGAAGFIGAAVCGILLADGFEVVGIDNLNDYYDVGLKLDRLALLGVDRDEACVRGRVCRSGKCQSFSFIRMDLEDKDGLNRLFDEFGFGFIAHFGAQAGVRYSVDHPDVYIKSNIDGFLNILECCRHYHVKHLVYASSSSVYGLNGKVPYSESDGTAHPASLYAATKKSVELMAHTYSHLFGIPTTGLRFFTVYGPWGRPDMSPFLFIDAILHDRPIKVFNNGDMWRDFTYIDDIVEGVVRILMKPAEPDPEWNAETADPASSSAPYRVYNIGNQHPTRLMDYIACIEKAAGKNAEKEFLPMQPGDVYRTYADSSALAKATGFIPSTSLEEGISRTVDWFKKYYRL